MPVVQLQRVKIRANRAPSLLHTRPDAAQCLPSADPGEPFDGLQITTRGSPREALESFSYE